ncbi:hypothetical protein KUCAC02_029617, partial [Chaenocephalus aceratus]
SLCFAICIKSILGASQSCVGWSKELIPPSFSSPYVLTINLGLSQGEGVVKLFCRKLFVCFREDNNLQLCESGRIRAQGVKEGRLEVGGLTVCS